LIQPDSLRPENEMILSPYIMLAFAFTLTVCRFSVCYRFKEQITTQTLKGKDTKKAIGQIEILHERTTKPGRNGRG